MRPWAASVGRGIDCGVPLALPQHAVPAMPTTRTLTPLLATLFLLSADALAAQTSIVRDEVLLDTVFVREELGPQIGQSFTLPTVSGRARVDFPNPGLAGVTRSRLSAATSFGASAHIDVTGIAPSTVVDGGLQEWFGGATSTWGLVDSGGGGRVLLGPSAPFVSGERFSLTRAIGFCGGGVCHTSGSWDPSHVWWAPIEAAPWLEVYFTFIDNGAWTFDAATSTPVDVQLNEFSAEVSITLSAVSSWELDASPVTEYCRSEANSTGDVAELHAFGSPTSMSEYFSVVVTDLPDGVFCGLLAGSAPAMTPMGTWSLCVGGTTQRVGGIQTSAAGQATFEYDLGAMLPGTPVYLQAIFRDPVLDVCASNGAAFFVELP